MASPLLIDYLNRCRAIYHLHHHAPVERTFEQAKLLQVPLRRLVRAMLVQVDGTLAMVVMPADLYLPLDTLRRMLAAKRVELAPERTVARCFPRCEPGAIPPIGHLFGLNAYALPLFETGQSVCFSAGSRSESVEMPFAEFRRLAHFDEIGHAERASPPAAQLPRRAAQRVHLPQRPLPASGGSAVALQGW
jgi:Ala-tRNA(Pro) deacylase